MYEFTLDHFYQLDFKYENVEKRLQLFTIRAYSLISRRPMATIRKPTNHLPILLPLSSTHSTNSSILTLFGKNIKIRLEKAKLRCRDSGKPSINTSLSVTLS